MGAYGGPDIITDGLVLAVDAASKRSYPGTGATWYDLSGNNFDFTFGAGLSWNSAGTFSMTAATGAVLNATITASTTCTMQFWIKTTDTQSLFWEPTASFVGAYRVDSKFYNGGGTGSPQYYQDLVLYNNIYDNLRDGEWHMVELKAVNLSSFTSHEFNNYGSYQFNSGEIANIMIYDRNLTAAESKQNYNAQKNRFL
jgi:hypothetical protein